MFRVVIRDLTEWKSKSDRKPLIINGARQVGKSWLVNLFGEEQFEGNIITINFEKRKEASIIFQMNYDVKRILTELEFLLNIQIRVGKDLLFFDEIQSCPNALSSLRYFYEDMPQLHLISAGSLLDFEFRKIPFPVGRVELLNLHPFTFYEFLLARGKDKLAEILLQKPTTLSKITEQLLLEELNYYFVVGGMPACVKQFIEDQNLIRVNKTQDELLYGYKQDFKKYQPNINEDCLVDILDHTSKNIGNQVIYTKLSNRSSGPTIKKGVDVLEAARLIHVVRNVSLSGLPLAVSTKQFKIFHLDIGLLLRYSKLAFQENFINKNLSSAFEGKLAEQFVAQQLIAIHNCPIYYWARTEPGNTAEVDFVISFNCHILPIEVKSGKSGSLKSLHSLLNKYPNVKEAIVYSHAAFGIKENIRFIPIYFAGRF